MSDPNNPHRDSGHDRAISQDFGRRHPALYLFWRMVTRRPLTAVIGLVALFVIGEGLGIATGLIQRWGTEMFLEPWSATFRQNRMIQSDQYHNDKRLHPGPYLKTTTALTFYRVDD